jgi:hypothetical protein
VAIGCVPIGADRADAILERQEAKHGDLRLATSTSSGCFALRSRVLREPCKCLADGDYFFAFQDPPRARTWLRSPLAGFRAGQDDPMEFLRPGPGDGQASTRPRTRGRPPRRAGHRTAADRPAGQATETAATEPRRRPGPAEARRTDDTHAVLPSRPATTSGTGQRAPCLAGHRTRGRRAAREHKRRARLHGRPGRPG